MATWRDHCRPIIAHVIAEVGTEDMKALNKALREAYPYGQKKYWPYKVWRDEVRSQLGLKPPRISKSASKDFENQLKLF